MKNQKEVKSMLHRNITLAGKQTTVLELIIRVGIVGTFVGHGYFAWCVKKSWIPLLTVYGFSQDTAIALLPLIGIQDFIIASIVLIRPFRIVLVWATSWAFMTALSRFFAGDPIFEFIERAANWTLPLVLLLLQGFPKTIKELFSVTTREQD
jgi:hypothetical protein